MSDIGKRRLAYVPVLRRLLFVGVNGWEELRKAESHPACMTTLPVDPALSSVQAADL